MSRIDCWFPTPIYITEDVCNDITAELETAVKKWQSQGTTRNPFLYVDTMHSSLKASDIKHEYPFNILAKKILSHANSFANQLGYKVEEDDLHIDNMWANVSGQGDFNFPHSHGDCNFSGAYYVKTTPENKIFFWNREFMTTEVSIPDELNELSFEYVQYNCVKNRLLMWRSNLVHGTPRQMEEGEKIVISYNISIKKKYN